jgi:peptidyl-prolyl cis-trans isomerase D
MYGLIQKHKRLAATVIAIASLSFLFWMFSVADIKQMFGLQRCVAVVEDSCITPREFRYELLKYQDLLEKKELRETVKRQVLYSLIGREALYLKAKSIGLIASEEEVADFISSDPSFRDGGKFSLTKYKEVLDRMGLRPEEYEEQVRKILSIRKLFRFIEGGTYVSDKEFEFQEKILSARFNGRAYLISKKSVRVDYEPSLEEMKRYYEENKDRFRSEPVKRYRVWETRNKEEAHSIYRSVKKGKLPEGGVAIEGGKLSPELLKLAKELSSEDRVTITKSKDRYIILFLEEELPSRIKSFEEAKEQIREIMRESRREDILRKRAEEVRERLSKGQPVRAKEIKFDNSKIEEFITLFNLAGDEVLRLVFSRERVFGPYRSGDGYVVLLIERRVFKPEELKRKEELRKELFKAKVDSLANLFADKIVNGASVQINEEYLR